MGGLEKGGGRKTSRRTPLPKRGTVRFPPPLGCRCSVFPVQKSTIEQTRSSFGGVQNFSGGRVLWYVFLPPYVLHPPPLSWPKNVSNYFWHFSSTIFARHQSSGPFWWDLISQQDTEEYLNQRVPKSELSESQNRGDKGGGEEGISGVRVSRA